MVTTYMACVALKFYRKTDDVDSDMEEMDTEDTSGATTAEDVSQPFSLVQLLKAADLRRPLFIACMLQVIQQFSGINAVSVLSQPVCQSDACYHQSLSVGLVSAAICCCICQSTFSFETYSASPVYLTAGRKLQSLDEFKSFSCQQ